MATYKKIVLATIIGFGLLGTTASANADKGQKIYQKKLKDACGETGAVIAAKHTQDEWEEAKENGEFEKTLIEVCPNGADFINSDKFKNKFSSHVYDFVFDYASDSGNIPSC